MLTLRQYQQEDVDFLKNKTACACFNEPRTGKSPTALYYLKERCSKRIVVVCPASAIPAWEEECHKWRKDITAYTCVGTKKKKTETVQTCWQQTITDTTALIISYDTLKETARSEGFVDTLIKNKIDGVVIDEAHRLKGRTTATAKAVFRLVRKVPSKIALTGTPAHGKPEDIWAILHALFPTTYSSYYTFIEAWCNITKGYNPNAHKEFSTPTGIKEECKEKFASILAEFSTVRKRKDVMPWLPEKDYCPIRLQLTPKQKNYLQQLETWFEIEGTNIVTTGILDRLIRYRQICLAPELLGLKGGSPKTDYIIQYIQDYPDESIIIFSSFTQYIKILQKKIPTARMIIGETPIPKRAEYCKAFQEGKIKILLINIQAGKEALTLDKATTTIFTDKFPPIGDITQAEDRFVATRPDIADKEHKIVELMMANSYDEMIYDLLAKRYSETDVINNYKNYIMKGVDVNGITS